MTKRTVSFLALIAIAVGLSLTAIAGCSSSDPLIVAPPDTMANDPPVE